MHDIVFICIAVVNKAEKWKTLGAEVTHAHNIICAFYADDHLPTYISLLTPVGNGRQSYTWQLQWLKNGRHRRAGAKNKL